MLARFLVSLVSLALFVAAAAAQNPAKRVAQQQQAVQQALKQQQAQLKKAQQQQQLAQAKQAKNKGKAPAPIQVGTALEQADALKKAYILLAGANHDYNGHRAKAMHEVHAAYKILDARINKRGTPQQKAVSQQEDALAAAARLAAKNAPKVHEDQRASDAQLAQASAILQQLHGVYANGKHPRLLGHVDKAVAEIATALTIR